MYNRAIVLLLLVFSFSAAGMAQRNNNNNTISGSVRTTDNQPVSDARVELRAVAGSLMKSGYTSFNGAFEFQDLPLGAYEVVVTVGANQTTERTQVQAGFNSLHA